jgi:hypothetical protein
MINQNRGWGILVLLIIVAFIVIVQVIVGAVSGDPQFCKIHAWPRGLSLLLAAAAVHFVVRCFNKRPGRSMIEANRRVLNLWGFVLAVAGVVLLFVHVG